MYHLQTCEVNAVCFYHTGQKFAQMEEKIILAKLFRRFTIETEETMETLIPLPDVVLRSETGVHVRLRKRL